MRETGSSSELDVAVPRTGLAALATIKAIKDALDPLGILNPGKIFPRSPLG